MVLTVTINPLLERKLVYNSVDLNNVNRNGKTELAAGGKGINVSRQLNNFNIENMAFTLLGGNEGKLLKDALQKENIKFTSVQTAAATRYASIIIDETTQKTYSFFECNSDISEKEVKIFKDKLEKMIQNCEIVVFSGSSPNELCNSIIPFGIECAHKYDKISVCDTYGSSLIDCLKAAPTVVHNNFDEIHRSLNVDTADDKNIFELFNRLYSYGIKQVFLTNGSNTFYASNFDFHFAVSVPEINCVDSTGCGDSFTAGVVYGLVNDLTFQQTLQFASKAGALNAASNSVCCVSLEEILQLKDSVVIEPKGKKIKIIDDTPD